MPDLITMLGVFTAVLITLQSWILNMVIRLEHRITKMEAALLQLSKEQ